MPQFEFHSFAKINIGLKILSQRSDSFHEIRTVFQTINLSDKIKIMCPSRRLNIVCRQKNIPEGKDNLMAKVVFLLRKKGYSIPNLQMDLDKKIPVGSGLGGGSSNAAATLMALNKWLGLNIPWHDMMHLAAQIGSDVPYFLWGGTALGAGRGDEIYPLKEIKKYWVCLAFPNKKSLTKDAYTKASKILTENKKDINITNFIYSILKGEPDYSLAENDFEKLLYKQDRIFSETKEIFKKCHSCCEMLSGSGSSIYALFSNRKNAVRAAHVIMSSRENDTMDVIVVKTMNSKEYHARLFHD